MNPNTYQISQNQNYPKAPPAPSPSDLKAHVNRAQEINARLQSIYVSLDNILGRIYGENVGSLACEAVPQPFGLSSEMAEALANIDGMATRLDSAVVRLSQFA